MIGINPAGRGSANWRAKEDRLVGGRIHSIRHRLRRTIRKGWFALTQNDLGMAINDGTCEATGWEFNPKRMGPPASAFARLASFVSPVFLAKEGDVDHSR